MADVLITEYTDPACPWAFSAEPFRHRLNWLYGDRLEWQVRMVVLSESAEDMEASGFDTSMLSSAYRTIARDHGMPIDTGTRPRMAASLPACRAVVAARLHAPESVRAVLRSLRVRNFAGELLDDPQTIAGAALDGGLDAEALAGWAAGEDVAAAIEEDKALARAPMPAARVLDHKLANWSGGRRYTCPSYEILRLSDGVRIAVPGFQAFSVYDVILANLVPDLGRRVPPEGVEEVLRWAGTPLASKEVAVLCGLEVSEAREALGRVATERHVGADGFWSL
jgi:predicted DsbA family dithiol-disulfide isomerase